MKCFTKILPLFLVLTLLCGCNFRLSSSADDLIAPITPFDENEGISSALDSHLNSGYTLKTPKNGKYTTSFVQFDVDNDGNNEAFAFFEPSNDLGTIHIAVLEKINGEWSVVSNVKGLGSDISEIAFANVYGESKKNILISWDIISKNSNKSLSIYNFENNNGKFKLKTLFDKISLTNFCVCDYNNDNIDEVMIFDVNNENPYNTNAALFSFKNGKQRKIGETKLDGNISAYAHFIVKNSDDGMLVYADAYKDENSSMITEIIKWSNYNKTIVSPFYNYSSGKTTKTFRNNTMFCSDIDEDGVVEIPLNSNACEVQGKLIVVDWSYYNNSVLKHKVFSLVNKQDGYQLLLNDKWEKKIIASYDNNSRVLTVADKNNGNVIFTIKSVLKSQYKKSKNSKEIIAEIVGSYCVAEVSDNNTIEVTLNDLKENIKNY